MDDAAHLTHAGQVAGCALPLDSDPARAVAAALARCGVEFDELYVPRPPADLAAAADRAVAAAAAAADDVHRLLDDDRPVFLSDVGAPADPVMFRAPTVVPAGWAPRRAAMCDLDYIAAFEAATFGMVPLPIRIGGGATVWATGNLPAYVAAGGDPADRADVPVVDLCVVGVLTGEETLQAVETVVREVTTAMSRRSPEGRSYNVSVGLSPGSVEIVAATHRSEVAAVLVVRVHLTACPRLSDLLRPYGQPAAHVAFNGDRAFTTRLGAYALSRRCNVVTFGAAPSGAGAAPSGAAPSGAGAAPSGADAAPSGADAAPSGADAWLDADEHATFGLNVAMYSRSGYATVFPHLRAGALQMAGGALTFDELVVELPSADRQPPAAATGPEVVRGRLAVDWEADVQAAAPADSRAADNVSWQERCRQAPFGHFESHVEDNLITLLGGDGQYKYSVNNNVNSGEFQTRIRNLFRRLAGGEMTVCRVIDRSALITRLAEKLSDVDRATGHRDGVGAELKAAALQMAVDTLARYERDDAIAWHAPRASAAPRTAARWYGDHYDATPRPPVGLDRTRAAAPPPPACFNAECPICMNGITPGAPNVVVLACRHAVHWADAGGCGGLNTWCQSGKKVCPICRSGFAAPPGKPHRVDSTYDLEMNTPMGRSTNTFAEEIEAAFARRPPGFSGDSGGFSGHVVRRVELSES